MSENILKALTLPVRYDAIPTCARKLTLWRKSYVRVFTAQELICNESTQFHDAFIGHARQRHDLIGCRGTRTVSVRPTSSEQMYTKAAVHTGVQLLRCEQLLSISPRVVIIQYTIGGEVKTFSMMKTDRLRRLAAEDCCRPTDHTKLGKVYCRVCRYFLNR